LTPDAVIGKTLAEVFPPDAVAAVTPYYQRAFAGEAVSFELEVAGQWYRLHAAPLPEAAGAPAAIIAVAHNVTARKQAEERLHFLTEISTLLARSLDYETTLRTIVDLAVPRVADWCSLNLVDAHGTFVRVAARHVDPQKEALLNDLRTRFPPAPVPPLRVPSGMYQEATLVPEVREADLQRFATRPEQRAVYQTLGVRSLLSVPLRAGEQLRGLLILVTAESGRTYGADDLLLAQDLASRAVVALENARLYRQVQEALRLRDELLALVSHDLKNPLGVIQLQAELLQRRLEGSAEAAPERTRERLAQITASATTMARLIEDLLDVARLHLGATLALNRHPTDLVALVRRQVLDQALDQQQRIRIEAAETVVVGDWDSVRVERVVANLLSNAIKYSPAGGEIVLTITREAHAGQPWAVLTVQDAGLGIPAPDLPAIFDRFQRAGNVAGRVSGAGIGLTSARQIVEQHGGSITVASTEGVGSTFTVRLPLGRPEVTCGVEGQPGHGA
jgi:signal transduction histidine kinase